MNKIVFPICLIAIAYGSATKDWSMVVFSALLFLTFSLIWVFEETK